MVDKVQALGFFRSSSADFHENPQHFDNQGSHNYGHNDAGNNACHLGNELAGISVEKAIGTGIINGFSTENTCHKSTPYAAHTMAAEGIQRVVIAKSGFDEGNEEIADERCGDTNEECCAGIYEACGRCYAYEAGEDAGHKTQGRHFLMNDFFNNNPHQTSRTGGNACIGQGLRHHIVGLKGQRRS